MQSGKDEILCPLCHGRGRNPKDLLVVRWRSREFEQELQKIADEAALGSDDDVVFEEELAYCNESD